MFAKRKLVLFPPALKPGRFRYPDGSRVEQSLYNRSQWFAVGRKGEALGMYDTREAAAKALASRGEGPLSMAENKKDAARESEGAA